MDEKTLSRLAQMAMGDQVSNNEQVRKIRSNVQATRFGKSAPYPDALLTVEQAKELVEDMMTGCKLIESYYDAKCDLTDETIKSGDQCYWIRGLKVARSTVEAICNA